MGRRRARGARSSFDGQARNRLDRLPGASRRTDRSACYRLWTNGAATGTAVLVLAAFVLPGFVTVLIRDRTYHARAQASSTELVLAALYYSALLYLAGAIVMMAADVEAADVTDLYSGGGSLPTYTGLAIAGVFLGPAIVAVAGKLWIDSRQREHLLRLLRVDRVHSTRSGWEYWFGQRRQCLMRVTLADGRVIGGYSGVESFAGFSVHGQDLFLEQRWELDDDGWFLRPADSSIGIYLRGDQIVTFEVYDYPTQRPAPPVAAV